MKELNEVYLQELLSDDFSQEILDTISPNPSFFDRPCVGCNRKLAVVSSQAKVTCPRCGATYVKLT